MKPFIEQMIDLCKICPGASRDFEQYLEKFHEFLEILAEEIGASPKDLYRIDARENLPLGAPLSFAGMPSIFVHPAVAAHFCSLQDSVYLARMCIVMGALEPLLDEKRGKRNKN